MLILILPAAAWAGARPVSLDFFIAETIRNNPTVKGYIKQYAESSGSEYAARGIDDVRLDSLFTLARNENPQLTGFDSTLDKRIAYEVGLSKLVSQSGTRLSAKWGDSWTGSRYPPSPIPGVTITPATPLYAPSLTLELTQPFLKNILGIQDRLDLNVKRIQLKATELSYQENIEKFISEMSNMYLSWLNSYTNAQTFRYVVRKVAEQVKLVRDEVEAKVAEESDLYRALEQQAFYKAALEGYLADFESTTREVAAMMYPNHPPANIKPVKTGGTFIDRIIAEGTGMDYLKHSSRLKGILDLSQDVQTTVLRANKNARLPDLNLFVKYRRHANAQGFNNSHGSAFNNDDVSGGLNVSVPITNRAARGTYHAQQAAVKRVQYENDRTMLDATSKLAALYKKKMRIEKQVKAYEQQFRYGRKKLEEEEEQYTDGRLTLFQLVQDQTEHISNSIRLEGSKTELAQTKLAINELTDRSLDAFASVIDEVVGKVNDAE